jgi:hypothetical protein
MSRENATDLGGKMTTGLLRIVPWQSVIFYKDMLHARIQVYIQQQHRCSITIYTRVMLLNWLNTSRNAEECVAGTCV